jgi:hypothetical protein
MAVVVQGDYWSCQLPGCHNYLPVFEDPFMQWGDTTCCDEHMRLCHERMSGELCMACGHEIPQKSCFRYYCGAVECKKLLVAQGDDMVFQSRQNSTHHLCTIHPGDSHTMGGYVSKISYEVDDGYW